MIYLRKHARSSVNASFWLLIYAALWLLLTGGAGWGFGSFVIVAATGLTLRLGLTPPYFKLLYLPRFLLFFLYELFVGALDVARRALHPHMPIDPAWVSFPFGCANPRVRLMLSAVVGLLPGTLAARWDATHLYLHVLDRHQDWHVTVAQTETHLARLFGVQV